MDAPKPPAQPSSTPPAAPGTRIQDRLAAAAKVKPNGGRLKTLVYLALGGTVAVIAVLQILGVLKNPVAESVLENNKKSRREIPKTAEPVPTEPKPPDGTSVPEK